MSTKHTPGPWELRPDGMGGFSALIFPVGTEYPVASVTGYHSSVGQRLQNARLIAAAPDLLAVAELLALATDEGDDLAAGTHYIDKTGRIRCKGSFLDTIERARAAIAKATGEQP